MKLIYLSFADPKRPKGTQFLGAAIVRASHIQEAVQVAWCLGINPGGEVQGVDIPNAVKVPDKWVECLLTKEDVDRMDEELASQ